MIYLISTVTHCQTLPVHRDMLVVERKQPDEKEMSSRAKLDVQALSQKLDHSDYAHVSAHSVEIYISQDIWQDEEHEAILSTELALIKAIRGDGSVDFSQVPDLFESCQDLANMTGYELGPDDPAFLVLHRNYSFDINGQTANLTNASSTGAKNPDLFNHPSKPLEGADAQARRAAGQKKIESSKLFLYDDLNHLNFYAYGALTMLRKQQQLAYQDAVDAIAVHEKEFYKKHKAASTKLNNLLGGFDVSSFYGKPFSELPASTQSQLANDNYRGFGFKTANAFANWLRSGTLSSSQGTVSIELGRGSDGAHFGLGVS
jgi:hypothetical protein